MEISAFLDQRAIIEELDETNRIEALMRLCKVLADLYPELELEEMVDVLLNGERLGSTGMGEGVAIPYGKLASLDRIVACFGRSSRGIEFDAVDNKPVHLFFVLFTPENSVQVTLETLSQIARLFINPVVRKELLESRSQDELYRILIRKGNDEGKRMTK